MMAKMSDGGTTRVPAAMTCASSGLPPTSCSTLASCDLRRVPLPAAMMAMATRGAEPVELFKPAFLDFFIYLKYIVGAAGKRRYEPGSSKFRDRVLRQRRESGR